MTPIVQQNHGLAFFDHSRNNRIEAVDPTRVPDDPNLLMGFSDRLYV
jgi:hypothetical protein